MALLVVCALITYGSFYPFDFDWSVQTGNWGVLAHSIRPFGVSRGDLLGNILLFVPFGFFGALWKASDRWRIGPLAALIGLGLLLALILQTGQLFLPSRDPALGDVFWNFLGIAAGGLVARLPFADRWQAALGDRRTLDIAALLGAVWALAQLSPFVPTLDLQAVKDSLKALGDLSRFDIAEIPLHVAAWLVALRFLSASDFFGRYSRYLPALPLVVIAAQIFIVGNNIDLTETSGAAVALACWIRWGSALGPRALTAFLVVGIVVSNLSGLNFGSLSHGFSWVPFSGFSEGHLAGGASGFLHKCFLYGALIWLLVEAGFGWMKSAAAVFAGLLAIELLQLYAAGRSPESTDPLLALAIAGALYRASVAVLPRNGPIESSAVIAADKPAAGEWTNMLVPVLQPQKIFMTRFAKEKDLSPSGAARHMISHFMDRYTLGTVGREDLERRVPGAGQVEKEMPIRVNLHAEQVAFLETLARDLGTDAPSVARLIIDDYIGDDGV